MFKFHMPELGEGLHEGEIIKWPFKEGEEIQEDETLVEVQNDKSVVEVPSPVTGTIKKIYIQEGEMGYVGDLIVDIDAPGYENVTMGAPEGAEEQVEGDTVAETKNEDHPVGTSGEQGAAEVEDPTAGQADPNAGEAGDAKAPAKGGKVKAAPAARKKARELGIDISQVTPTGKFGHITVKDVENFDPSQVASAAPAGEGQAAASAGEAQSLSIPVSAYEPYQAAAAEAEERKPMSKMRRIIAENMQKQNITVPAVTLFDEVEVSALYDHRKKYKEIAADQDVKLTFLPYVVKALIGALKKFPELNTSLDESTSEIVYKNYYNIGIATDTERGLLVPNVKDANTKSIFQIASEIDDLASRAHESKLTEDEMRGGTITISNLGSARGSFFTPIINPPEVAILGFGSIAQQPIVNEDGELAVGRVAKLSLTFDHRVIDGATAQLALNEFKRLLANPDLILMEG